MILLDTHAAIWLGAGHRRSRPLERFQRLHLSPVSILEVQFLLEAGRLRLAAGRDASELADDDRWRLDEPPAAKLFTRACELGWTRDPGACAGPRLETRDRRRRAARASPVVVCHAAVIAVHGDVCNRRGVTANDSRSLPATQPTLNATARSAGALAKAGKPEATPSQGRGRNPHLR
jgi:hypothetical protein